MKWVSLTQSMVVIALAGTGCTATQPELKAEISHQKLRSFQSRAFNTTDLNNTLRAVLATLLDLEFIIEDADFRSGTVSARKIIDKKRRLRTSVSVQPRGENQLVIRATMLEERGRQLYKKPGRSRPIHDPELFRTFFTELQKTLFSTKHEVNSS